MRQDYKPVYDYSQEGNNNSEWSLIQCLDGAILTLLIIVELIYAVHFLDILMNLQDIK